MLSSSHGLLVRVIIPANQTDRKRISLDRFRTKFDFNKQKKLKTTERKSEGLFLVSRDKRLDSDSVARSIFISQPFHFLFHCASGAFACVLLLSRCYIFYAHSALRDSRGCNSIQLNNFAIGISLDLHDASFFDIGERAEFICPIPAARVTKVTSREEQLSRVFFHVHVARYDGRLWLSLFGGSFENAGW